MSHSFKRKCNCKLILCNRTEVQHGKSVKHSQVGKYHHYHSISIDEQSIFFYYRKTCIYLNRINSKVYNAMYYEHWHTFGH